MDESQNQHRLDAGANKVFFRHPKFAFFAILLTFSVFAFLRILSYIYIESQSLADWVTAAANVFSVVVIGVVLVKLVPPISQLGKIWLALFLAQVFYAVGDILYAFIADILHLSPFPSVADIFYLGYYPFLFMAIGLLVNWRKQKNSLPWGLWLDLLVVVSAAGIIFWNLWMAPTVSHGDLDFGYELLVTLAYPIADLIMCGGIAILIYLEVKPKFRFPILLMAGSASLLFLADGLFYYQTWYLNPWLPILTDCIYIAGSALMALTAWEQIRLLQEQEKSRQGLDYWRLLIAYLWLLAVLVIWFMAGKQAMAMSLEQLTGWVIFLILTILVRHFLAMREIFSLNQKLEHQLARLQFVSDELQKSKSDLELRVAERTTELASTNLALSVEIEVRKEAEERLLQRATHDSLTGLYNRAFFLEKLQSVVSKFKIDPSSTAAVFFLDLDRFKVINDSIGHEIGDQYLTETARRLLSQLRHDDTAARLGGDEFALLVENIDEEGALSLAERILEKIARPVFLRDYELPSSVSIGIAIVNGSYTSADSILRDADISMYQAKAKGRSTCVMFNPQMHNAVMLRMQLEADLRRAMDMNELCIHYQPILSLQDNRVVGVEALLRWEHPTRGMIYPGEFIHLAEESRLINRLGEWVIKTACQQMQDWRRRHEWEIFLSVNLSPVQMLQQDLSGLVLQIVDETGFPPDHLVLEMTEEAVMENASLAVRLLNELVAGGIQIALDDFGCGYSSLASLRDFPINIIKIDKSFVRQFIEVERYELVTRLIISIAHLMSMKVIAEGLEEEQQREMLMLSGCDMVQGYLICKALPAGQLEEYLQDKVKIG